MAIKWKMRGFNDRRLYSKACCSGNIGNTVQRRDHECCADTIRIHAMPSIDRPGLICLPDQILMMMDNPDTGVEIVPLGKSQVEISLRRLNARHPFIDPSTSLYRIVATTVEELVLSVIPHSSTHSQPTHTQLLLHLHHYSRSHPAFTSFDSTHQYRSSPTDYRPPLVRRPVHQSRQHPGLG